MTHCNLSVPQAMATLNGVKQSMSGAASGAKKRTRHSSSPSKTNSEDLAKQSFPTLQSSSMAEHESNDSLDWPTTGPFTYHRWHVMIERWAQCLWSSQCIASLAYSKASIVHMLCEYRSEFRLGNQSKCKSHELHSVGTCLLASHQLTSTHLN